MPLPKPRKQESEKDFIKRSMSSEVMKSEFPDIKQRFAVIKSLFKKKMKYIKEFLEYE